MSRKTCLGRKNGFAISLRHITTLFKFTVGFAGVKGSTQTLRSDIPDCIVLYLQYHLVYRTMILIRFLFSTVTFLVRLKEARCELLRTKLLTVYVQDARSVHQLLDPATWLGEWESCWTGCSSFGLDVRPTKSIETSILAYNLSKGLRTQWLITAHRLNYGIYDTMENDTAQDLYNQRSSKYRIILIIL